MHAGSATVADVQGTDPGAAQMLELAATDEQVEIFTDRPTRLTGEMPVHEFLALWHGGGFGSDPPNAAVLMDGETVAMELDRAVYDPATQRIAFAVDRLDTAEGAPGDLLPVGTSGETTLFIDAIGVNPQVTDPVTQANVKVLGDAPTQAMGSLYQTMSQSTGIAYQNAESQQSVYSQPSTTDQNVPLLYSVDTGPCPPDCYSYFVNPD